MADMKRQKNPYPLGAQPDSGGIRFSFVSENPDCGILLYDVAGGKKMARIPFSEEDRIGTVYCKTVQDIRAEEVCYQFYSGRAVVPDEHGRKFVKRCAFGREQAPEGWKAGFLPEDYDWENDRHPGLPYSASLFYCVHVRGFTKHASSGVTDRGTFLGLAEKIPYLKEIGVTTLELQPAYEFAEYPFEEEDRNFRPYGVQEPPAERSGGKRVNYWGYKKGFYYAPKAAYAAGEDAPAEFRSLVKSLHKNGMELVMQFYFPTEVNRSEILEILRFWVLEYHVDGFHLMGEQLPVDMLAADPLLADCKLLYYYFNSSGGSERDYRREEKDGQEYPHLAEYNDDYLYDMRRFLKGDENMLGSVMKQMRYIPGSAGRIHYLTNYYGFTLGDLVSYDHKHNEANGEDNRDGNDYNCSWNCGEEGPTRSRKIKALRIRQIKNAMCMLLFTQSTPLIFMGDEFGNTQKGNNNPWCQDNPTAWLDWNCLKKNRELLEFWKRLVAFRKAHPILHPEREFRLMDYRSCGYPDLSYHGESAWRPQTESYHRHIGMLFCGKYAETEGKEDAFLYLAVNMHWESHELALPKLPRGLRWETAIYTGDGVKTPEGAERENRRLIEPRSMAVFIGVPEPEKAGQKSRKGSAEK